MHIVPGINAIDTTTLGVRPVVYPVNSYYGSLSMNAAPARMQSEGKHEEAQWHLPAPTKLLAKPSHPCNFPPTLNAQTTTNMPAAGAFSHLPHFLRNLVNGIDTNKPQPVQVSKQVIKAVKTSEDFIVSKRRQDLYVLVLIDCGSHPVHCSFQNSTHPSPIAVDT